jgi:hypothetical protein
VSEYSGWWSGEGAAKAIVWSAAKIGCWRVLRADLFDIKGQVSRLSSIDTDGRSGPYGASVTIDILLQLEALVRRQGVFSEVYWAWAGVSLALAQGLASGHCKSPLERGITKAWVSR